MSIAGRLTKLESVIEGARPDSDAGHRSALRVLAQTIAAAAPDASATLTLTAALLKTLAGVFPDVDPAELYLSAEEGAALTTWRDECARHTWPALPVTDEDRRTAAYFLSDWHDHLATAELWRRTGYLEPGTDERRIHAETAERGARVWGWGGWTMHGLPWVFYDDPRPVPEQRRRIAAALVSVAQ